MLISVQASLPVKHAKYVGEGKAPELGLSLLSFFLLFVVSKYVGGTGVGCGIERICIILVRIYITCCLHSLPSVIRSHSQKGRKIQNQTKWRRISSEKFKRAENFTKRDYFANTRSR